jgi:hypothetical protein
MPNPPDWLRRWPEAFAIVTGFFPETKPREGGAMCRPLLVTQVKRRKSDGSIFLRIAYGTSQVRFPEKANTDLIVQNVSDLDECGLMTPTRFVIEPAQQVIRSWDEEHFKPWGGSSTPRRGRLPDHLQHEYAFLMAQHLRS